MRFYTSRNFPLAALYMASSKSQSPQEKYGLSCPSGGSFYVCESSPDHFIGCCETDPCSNGGQCLVGGLRPASYDNYPDDHQSCVAPYDENEWYTCDLTTPKFMGCCLQNPCGQGCPDWALIPARLDDDEYIAASFLNLQSRPPKQVGFIVGLSVMGAILLLVIACAFWRRKITHVWRTYRQFCQSSSSSMGEFFGLKRGNGESVPSVLQSELSSTSSNGTAYSLPRLQLRVMNP
ncbi:hypothetical protein F5Y11DRAFT_346213 [Daldinia sp. FL1419]|nr:hypothetical protein F5Y11DRAFT_346213 [Daldinia sp. FL1419]